MKFLIFLLCELHYISAILQIYTYHFYLLLMFVIFFLILYARYSNKLLMFKSYSTNVVNGLSCVLCVCVQRAADEERMQFLQLVFQNSPAGPIRPSVLRSTALLLQGLCSNELFKLHIFP